MLHVWYIYLQNWVIYWVNVGKYTIHGASGIVIIHYGNLKQLLMWLVLSALKKMQQIANSYLNYSKIITGKVW